VTADDLGRLVDSLLRPTVLTEAAAVALCLLLAWAGVRCCAGSAAAGLDLVRRGRRRRRAVPGAGAAAGLAGALVALQGWLPPAC
jgi:hypothetical protein